MMKEEFLRYLNEVSETKVTFIDDDKYEIIETVYNYHPSIFNKEQIVFIYVNYGMIIILDMLPRAKRIKELENIISDKNFEILSLKEDMEKIMKGEL